MRVNGISITGSSVYSKNNAKIPDTVKKEPATNVNFTGILGAIKGAVKGGAKGAYKGGRKLLLLQQRLP